MIIIVLVLYVVIQIGANITIDPNGQNYILINVSIFRELSVGYLEFTEKLKYIHGEDPEQTVKLFYHEYKIYDTNEQKSLLEILRNNIETSTYHDEQIFNKLTVSFNSELLVDNVKQTVSLENIAKRYDINEKVIFSYIDKADQTPMQFQYKYGSSIAAAVSQLSLKYNNNTIFQEIVNNIGIHLYRFSEYSSALLSANISDYLSL